MHTEALEKLDSFPYRHRVADLMSAPLVRMTPSATVVEAARLMVERRVSSVVVLDENGRLAGILTEHDLLRLVASDAAQLERPIAEAMSRPVHSVSAGALLYRAIARMARQRIRHLPVVDEEEHAVGMLTAGALLKQRVTLALTLGDEIDHAADGDALRAAHDRLPAVAAALREEGVPAIQVSAVVSGVVCDLTARAGELALAEMGSEAPSPWCLLVLGSAGRGESLLAADQDNALIHQDEDRDGWFAGFGERLNAILAAAGVPLCTGGVMARNPAFRRSLAAWRTEVDSWVSRPQPQALMNVDIFYDFVPVLGDRALALELRRHAVAAASSPLFLRLLAAAGSNAPGGIDMLGRLRTERGRIDLKLHGLFPLVAGARIAALAWNLTATSSDIRLTEAAARGALAADTAADLVAARALLVEAILDQQLADLAAGQPVSNRVDPKRLGRRSLQRLRKALEAAASVPDIVRGILTNRRPESAP